MVTVDAIRAFLRLEISEAEEIAAAEAAITEATAMVRNYTNQIITAATTEEALDVLETNRRFVLLSQLPVNEVLSLEEDGEALTEGEGFAVTQFGALLRLPWGSYWERGVGVIEVEYDSGYDPVPQDILEVVTRAASRRYQMGLASLNSDGVPGVSGKSLGDFSVSFEVGANEGVMGASGGRILLFSEREILDAYKPGVLRC